MKLVYKIIYTVLMLPGIVLIWILIATLTSSRASMTSDYFLYVLPMDLGRTARWSFPLALFIAVIILIFIWSSGKGSQKAFLNEQGSSPREKKAGRGSGEYQDGNPYS